MTDRTDASLWPREAEEKAGVSFLVGMEHEFMLLSATNPEPVFVNDADWSCAAKIRTGSTEALVLEEIAQCLVDAGLEVQQYHAEAAPGQVSLLRQASLRMIRRRSGH